MYELISVAVRIRGRVDGVHDVRIVETVYVWYIGQSLNDIMKKV